VRFVFESATVVAVMVNVEHLPVVPVQHALPRQVSAWSHDVEWSAGASAPDSIAPPDDEEDDDEEEDDDADVSGPLPVSSAPWASPPLLLEESAAPSSEPESEPPELEPHAAHAIATTSATGAARIRSVPRRKVPNRIMLASRTRNARVVA
jgi:hypothetical protein